MKVYGKSQLMNVNAETGIIRLLRLRHVLVAVWWLFITLLSACSGALAVDEAVFVETHAAEGHIRQSRSADNFQRRFLTFCDFAAMELNKKITRFADRDNADPATHHMPFFEDAHAVRALTVAKGALDWMTHQDFREVKPITFQQRPSGIIFYCFELYAAGLRYLKPGSRQYERVISQIDLALDWMAKSQKTQGANVPDYLFKNVDLAGLPCLMSSLSTTL